ncbi:MAG: hypothetical protein ABI426_05985 [Flavobacterium sp.]
MKQILLLSLLVFLFTQSIFSQSLLKGKVISDASNLEGILVVNLSSKSNTATEKSGFFSIFAKPNDTLLFSGLQIKGIQVVLKATDFSENLFFMRLKAQINMLDEVYIRNYPEINAFSLGIIPKGTKSYTPAQRKLRTASSTFASSNVDGSAGVAVGLDPLLNWFSGRTTMLKKELEVETKERLIARLEGLYEEEFYTKTLKIPSEYIKGFQIFMIDDARFVSALKSKNKTLTTFLLGEMAEKYKLVLSPEKK